MFSNEVIEKVLVDLERLEYETMELELRFHDTDELTEEEFKLANNELIEKENSMVTNAVEEKYIYDGCICQRLHFNELFWSEYYEAKGGK